MDLIYLDHNATTCPAPEVLEAMQQAQSCAWANPSSVHRAGQQARHALELARATLAKLIDCRPAELILTSGGTESSNLALSGLLDGREGAVLITSPLEHSAVREPAAFLAERGVDVRMLPAGIEQVIDPRQVAAEIEGLGDEVRLVVLSVQWANNETGVIQPIAALAEAAREAWGRRWAGLEKGRPRPKLLVHTDATQAVGKVAVSVKEAGVDLLTLAAHKFYGPRGLGGLFVRTGVRPARQLHGGPQERDRRGGTENVAAAVGAAKAAELAMTWLADPEGARAGAALRDRLETGILDRLPDSVVHRGTGARLWNTTNIGFPRLEAEAILLGLSERGVCVSAGAACSSGSLEPSPVLLAMGIPRAVAHGSIRFSLGRHTTVDEIERAVTLVTEVVGRLRSSTSIDQLAAVGAGRRDG